ncbi:ester cyclase [Janthinobacterium fluminis]|uniref:Ester cyclase n=1 Tax=Janthinobacterium fluminis TaxID=2987524 RepID=A0ABT5K1B7_9BURK|nr:ester cyclase [Janthinobacterium fluminis]MDC8757557.1 ester cyclase [Janthinobacterium fluminis]
MSTTATPFRRPPFLIAAAFALCQISAPFALAADPALPAPQQVFTGGKPAELEAVMLAARRYAAFWNSGDAALARQALAPEFTDRTLPAGRAQGLAGPLQASLAFRGAVPDLKVEITDLVAAGDRVTLRLHFSGHFTGRFGEVQGKGQTIEFQAFDMYRVADGRITDNWHLEDNLTLLRQMGIVQQ